MHWEVVGKRLIGWQDADKLVEWYGLSGGQLKYYPRVEKAIWSSNVFQLEPLPLAELGYVSSEKPQTCFLSFGRRPALINE